MLTDLLVIGTGLAALAAGHRARERGRSVVFVEAHSERPVRSAFIIDPTALADRELTGSELDTLVFHTPTPHSLTRFFADASTLTIERVGGRLLWRDATALVSARRVLFAPAPGEIEIPDVQGARELAGLGVTTCAWSDAPFFGAPVLVVGDGDFAYESALFSAARVPSVILLRDRRSERGKRASLQVRVERNAHIRKETGRVTAVRDRTAERLLVEIVRDDGERSSIDVGGLVFANEPVHARDIRELGERLRMVCGDDFAVAGGLAGIDETDHAALVRDGFRAAELQER